MTMSRSSLRIRCTHTIVSVASLAGSTAKSWSYLFLKYRASFARRPARASATGDDSRPAVDTSLKSTTPAMVDSFERYVRATRPASRGSLGASKQSLTFAAPLPQEILGPSSAETPSPDALADASLGDIDAGAGCLSPGAATPVSAAADGLPADGIVLWMRADRGVY